MSLLTAPETDIRSRWDRWGLSRSKRDRTPSKSSAPATPKEGETKNVFHSFCSWYAKCYSFDQQFQLTMHPFFFLSDFPPVFHITLKDHVLLEGNPVTLSCLPAGSPEPIIVWMKGIFHSLVYF